MERLLRLPVKDVDSSFYRTQKPRLLSSQDALSVPPVHFEKLSDRQRNVVQIVRKHLAKPLDEQQKNPLQMLCLGVSGSGKSACLLQIKKELELKQRQNPDFNIKVVSFTGISAFNVGGETIHAAFHLNPFMSGNINQLDKALKFASKKKIVDYFSTVSFVLLDEVSFVGCRLLHYVHKFLQQTHPVTFDQPFGGVSFVFFGDIYQTKAIKDLSPFEVLSPMRREDFGEIVDIWYGIPNAFFLDESFRQPTDSTDSLWYFHFLTRMRNRQLTVEDVGLIQARTAGVLPPEQIQMFANALHVFPLRRLVRDRNSRELRKRFSTDLIMRMQTGFDVLELAIGCEVMLRTNLATKAGITNGCRGFVREIVFKKDFVKMNPTLPTGGWIEQEDVKCVIVDFSHYKGQISVVTENGNCGLPVFRTRDEVMNRLGKWETVDVFKLELAYATTCHRVQGLTLDRIAIHLESRQIFHALDYVSFSRVRQLTHVLILDDPVTMERFIDRADVRNRVTLTRIEEKRVREVEKQMMRAYSM